jgi:hypothetical protein
MFYKFSVMFSDLTNAENLTSSSFCFGQKYFTLVSEFNSLKPAIVLVLMFIMSMAVTVHQNI